MNRGDKIALVLASAFAVGVVGASVYNAIKPKGLEGITITRITVLPYQSAVQVGDVIGLVATAYYSDGSSKNITWNSFWISSNQAVAVVQSPGEIQALTHGTTSVEVNYLGITGVALISVT